MTDRKRKAGKKPAPPYWGFLSTLGLIIALVASLATLASIWLQIRKTFPNVDIILVSSQNLTNLPQIPQLKAKYTFAEREVKDLWQARVTLVNSGTRTIIGEGPQKNIVKDAIIVTVGNGFRLLQLQTDSADFPNEIVKLDLSHFSLKFLQWRRNETVNLTLYLERLDLSIAKPFFGVDERYLLDGDITFVNSSASPLRIKRPLIDRMPPLVASALRTLALTVFIVLLIFSLIAIGFGTNEFVRLKAWRQKYFAEFSKFVQKEFPDMSSEILAKPSFAPRVVWEKFPGPRLSVTKALYEGEKPKMFLTIFVLAMIFVLIALLSGIAGLWII